MNTLNDDGVEEQPISNSPGSPTRTYFKRRPRPGQSTRKVKSLKDQIMEILSPSQSRQQSIAPQNQHWEQLDTEQQLNDDFEQEEQKNQAYDDNEQIDDIGTERSFNGDKFVYEFQESGKKQHLIHIAQKSDEEDLPIDPDLHITLGTDKEIDILETSTGDQVNTMRKVLPLGKLFSEGDQNQNDFSFRSDRSQRSQTVKPSNFARKESTDEVEKERVPSKRSLKWKKAKQAVTIMSFSSGANNLVDKRADSVMRGEAKLDTSKLGKRRLYISPESKQNKFWEAVIGMTLLYYAFAVPYRVGQGVQVKNWLAVDIPMDCIILLDMIFTFFTGYKTHDLKMVHSKKQIAQRYLKRNFWYDLLAIMPLQYAGDALYAFKIFRLIHIQKLAEIQRKIAFKISSNKGFVFFKYAKFLFIFFVSLNFLSCMWVALGKYAVQDGKSWISELKNKPESFPETYLNSVFFVITTASTVGFGDIDPVTNAEQLVCMVVEFMGIIIIAFYQSQIHYFVKNASMFSARTSDFDLDLEKWLFEKERSKTLFSSNHNNTGGQQRGDIELGETIQQIHSYFKFHRANNLSVGGEEFLAKMDPESQNQVILKTYRDLIQRFEVFLSAGDDLGFGTEIITKLKPKAFYPGEKIIKRGTRPRGIYFIIKGRINIMNTNKEVVSSLSDGSFFGDIILLDRNASFTYITGAEICKCFFIPSTQFLDIVYRYDEAYNYLKAIAFARNDRFVKTSKQLREKRIELLENFLLENYGKKAEDIEYNKKAEDLSESKISRQEQDEPEPEEFNAISVQDVSIPDQPHKRNASESCNYVSINQNYSKRSIRSFEVEFQNKVFEMKKFTTLQQDQLAKISEKLSDDENPLQIAIKNQSIQNHSIQPQDSPSNHTPSLGQISAANKNLRYMYTVDNTPDSKAKEEFFSVFKNKNAEQVEQEIREEEEWRKQNEVEIDDEAFEVKAMIDELQRSEDNDNATEVDSGDFDEDAWHGVDKSFIAYSDDEGDFDENDGSELQHSLEVPIDNMDPDFDEDIDTEYILSYFDSRIDTINNKMEKIQKQLRNDCISEVKISKKFISTITKKQNPGSEDSTPRGPLMEFQLLSKRSSNKSLTAKDTIKLNGNKPLKFSDFKLNQ